MTPIKRSFSYYFKDSYLRLQLRWDKKRVILSTGFEVDKTDAKGKPKWDGIRCKNNTFHGKRHIPASAINRVLDDLESKIAELFYSFEIKDTIPTPQDVKDWLRSDKKPGADIWDAFKEFISDGENVKGWTFNTVKSVKGVEAILRQFNPDLRFEEINTSTLNDIISHMGTNRVSSNEFKSGQKGYSNATIVKHFRTLRWFLSWATQKGYLQKSAWENFSPSVKTIRQPIIFLEWDELMRLESSDFYPGSEEERAKDFFLFCCFTGLRYSDAANLKKDVVFDNYFEVVSIKTSTPLRIELNDHSRRIIEKYKDSDSIYALPRITNNRLNHLLKDIGEVLNIETTVLSSQFYGTERVDRKMPKYQKLSSHCARRTFICNAIALGIPPHVVMKWTGHTDFNSMKPYLEIANKIKEESMAKFNR